MCALMRWGMRKTPERAPEETEMSLTGKFAFRRSLTGKIVLKVEEEVKLPWPLSRTAKSRRRWRDARLLDLTEAELRTLMDLRNRPQLVPHSATIATLPRQPPAEDGRPAGRPAPCPHAAICAQFS